MGTWLHSNIVFDFEFEWDKRAVFAGTFCREFTGHIYWHAALHSCSSSSYSVNWSSLSVWTQTTCICLGGEVNLFVTTVLVNRRTLIALQPLRSQEQSLYSTQIKRNIQVETRRAARCAIQQKER